MIVTGHRTKDGSGVQVCAKHMIFEESSEQPEQRSGTCLVKRNSLRHGRNYYSRCENRGERLDRLK